MIGEKLSAFKALGPVAWVLGNVQLVLALAGAFMLCMTLSYCKGRSDGIKIEQGAQLDREQTARELSDKSAGKAAQERSDDAKTISTKEQDRSDAIQSTDDEKPSASSNALNCQRMRDNGQDVSLIPACGGRSD